MGQTLQEDLDEKGGGIDAVSEEGKEVEREEDQQEKENYFGVVSHLHFVEEHYLEQMSDGGLVEDD